MTGIRRALLSLTALLLISGVALVNPVYARDSETMGGQQPIKPATQIADTDPDDPPLMPQDLANKFKQEAKDKTAQQRTEVKEQTQEKRHQSCEARKANLQTREANSVKHANQLKTVFDGIYQKVKDFHDTKQLNTPNYESLVAAVDSAQVDATTNISALSALQVDVDCSQSNVADSVSSFQQAVKSTRDSLKNYRKSITALIVAVKNSNTGDTSTDNSSGAGQ